MQYKEIKTIYDLVKCAGEEHKNRVFLRYEVNDEIIDVTYGQFVNNCKALAAWLKDENRLMGHKVNVALLGSSSEAYLTALLGGMSSGNIVIPLDTQVNVDTLSDALNRADAEILFYDWEHAALVEGIKEVCPKIKKYISLQHGKHVPCLEQVLNLYAGSQIAKEVDEEDCAMILFTSGTTGKSKGVMLSHKNLIDNTFCTTDKQHPEQEVYLNVLPIHHVFCINGDLLIVMRYGSTLCLNGEMSKFMAHIKLFEPSVIRMVPMMAKMLYNQMLNLEISSPELSKAEIRKAVLGSNLHKIISGGGYLNPELVDHLGSFGIKIAQGYGMSECSPKISTPDFSRPDKAASVGRIVDRCQVKIVDGEIWAKSPSVMMGYYKDPEQTAKTLTEDGWLRTGDLGYVDEENFLYLTGRKKNLIILSNGENVAPEQLENLFVDESLLQEILVFEEQDSIAAAIYPNFKYADLTKVKDIAKEIEGIIKAHNETLPTYKQITRWYLRETPFQKTSSKKIIRSLYFNQKTETKEALQHFKMPQNQLQQTLYNCVSKVLGHSSFGVDTNLYTVGLNSLGSVMLLTQLQEQLKCPMQLSDLIQHTSIEALEGVITANINKEEVDYSIRKVYPLTNVQLYFATAIRGNTTGNLPFLFKLDPCIDVKRLKKAIEGLFEVHPNLKCIIQKQEGQYECLRDDEKVIDIPIIKLSDEEWEKTRENLLVPYFYEVNEPLYHIGIYITPTNIYLFFDISHAIGDGVTMNILFEDLNTLYRGEEIPKETYSYYEYVLDNARERKQGLAKEKLNYFNELFSAFKIEKSILTRKHCYDLSHGEDATMTNPFKTLNKNEILAFCNKYGVSENVLFITAFNYCISIFSNTKEAVSTSIHSGRIDSRFSRLAGPFFNNYVFRYTNIPHETVPELLKRSGEQIINTMANYTYNIRADEMFFQYQGEILNIDHIGDLPAERLHVKLNALPFHLQVMSKDNGYYYLLRYWQNRFDKKQLALFMEAFETIVAAMLEEPSVRRLKKHLSEHLFPKHYFVKVSEINKSAGYKLIGTRNDEEMVKAYVFDHTCRKQPYGAWGDLYIMDTEPEEVVDQITNPYGQGRLYQTRHTARILPDGSIDLLEESGRVVVKVDLVGYHYIDLHELEKYLCAYEGIESAKAYTSYIGKPEFAINVEIKGEDTLNEEEIREYLSNKYEACVMPDQISIETVTKKRMIV